jgi:hypothetical protein
MESKNAHQNSAFLFFGVRMKIINPKAFAIR